MDYQQEAKINTRSRKEFENKKNKKKKFEVSACDFFDYKSKTNIDPKLENDF